MALKNDPWSDAKFGPGKPPPLPGAVNKFHEKADTDTGPLAIHHTLGVKGNQAAAGDHTHNAYTAAAYKASGALAYGAFDPLEQPALYDPMNMYDDTNATYTIKRRGLYELSGSLYFTPRTAVANHLLLVVRIDGGEVFRWSAPGAVAATGQGTSGSASALLDIGRTVQFVGYQDGSNPGPLTLGACSHSVRMVVDLGG